MFGRFIAFLPAVVLIAGCTQLIGIDDTRIDTDAGTTPGDDGGTPLVCTAPMTDCDGACTSTGDDALNCGRCGRSCGGGSCMAGACQPVDLITGLTGLNGLAVDADRVYFSQPTRVAACDLVAGCSGGVTELVLRAGRITAMALAGDTFYWAGPHSNPDSKDSELFECPIAGCSATPTGLRRNFATFFGLVAGDARLLALASPSSTCALADCAGTIQTVPGLVIEKGRGHTLLGDTLYVLSGDQIHQGTAADDFDMTALRSGNFLTLTGFQDRLYWAKDFAGEIRIEACTLPTCTEQRLATDFVGVNEIAADRTGVYWLTSSGIIRTCLLTGCVGAPKLIAEGQTGAARLTLGDDFVYWSVGDTIRRAAKP